MTIANRDLKPDNVELDLFINTWVCERGGRHRVYRLCDCPGMGLDLEALKRGHVRVVPVPEDPV